MILGSELPASSMLVRPLKLATAMLLGCISGVSVEATAADWTFSPRIAVSADYDDNNRLTDVKGQEVEVSGAKVDAQFRIAARTQRTDFSVVPRLRSTFYPGERQEEANDQFLRIDLRHETQRTESYLDAYMSSVVTFGSYFPSSRISDDDQLGNPDSGVDIGTDDTRNRENRVRIQPGISFALAERHELEVGAEYLDVGYDEQIQSDRVDYTNVSAFAAYRWRVSETASLGLRLSGDRYKKEDDEDRDSYSLRAELSSRWSETTEAYVRGGISAVEARQPGKSGYESGFSGGAGVRWAFELTNVFLDVNQYLDPNSSGDIVSRSQFRFTVSRRLSERTTFTAGLRGIHDAGAPGDEGYPWRKYATTDAGFEWRLSRQFMLFGLYQYRWRDRENAGGDAESNGVSVGILWDPSRR